MQSLEIPIQCPECGASLVNDSELVCPQCGLVIDDNQFVYLPPRTYSREDVKKRTITEAFINLPTQFYVSGKLPPQMKRQFTRLLAYQISLKNSMRPHIDGHHRLKTLISQLNLPQQVFERAERLYQKSVKLQFNRGHCMLNVCLACIYVACRQLNVPVLYRELRKISASQHKPRLQLVVRKFCEQFKIQLIAASAGSYVPMFCSQLKLSHEIENVALEIANGVQLCGKSPTGIAAASVYLAANKSGVRISQKIVATLASVTEVTIRSITKKIVQKLTQ